jgi:hypothetical protein
MKKGTKRVTVKLDVRAGSGDNGGGGSGGNTHSLL